MIDKMALPASVIGVKPVLVEFAGQLGFSRDGDTGRGSGRHCVWRRGPRLDSCWVSDGG